MTNYTRGRAREYQTMRILRGTGWVCTRSAMSHGPIDIIAARSGDVLLIQVKSGSARAKRDELSLLRKWATEFNATAEVWSFRTKGMVRRMRVRSKEGLASPVTLTASQILPA